MARVELMDTYKNEGLDKYAETQADRDTFRALVDCGGDYDAMAKLLDVTVGSVRSRLHRLRKRAALRGWAPTQDVRRPTMEGFSAKRISSYAKPTGPNGEMEVTGQWMIQDRDKQQLAEAMRIACEALAEPLKGVINPVRKRKPKRGYDPDLMATYLIGDHHLGMLSWATETGADYDCDIAEKILRKAFKRLGAAAPRAHKALIVSIGDLYHADNHSSRTPRSGVVLDVDGRYSKVIQAGIRMMMRAIDFALKKHEVVEVVIVGGNHDPESSIWLAHSLHVAYERDPRVSVQTAPRAYRYVKWGRCLIGLSHGEKCKPDALGEIMAVDCPQWWGEAVFRHWYTGHVHHKWKRELRGCIVESLSVLPPGDAWHVGQGYRSQRGMQMDVWHKEQGCVMSITGTVEYIQAA